MTLIRQLALKISNAVHRFASPGSKDWAKATACELELIGSDWEALRWALGSTRVLLKRHEVEAPIASLADLPRVAQVLSETLRKRRRFGNAFVLIEGVLCGCSFLLLKRWPMMRFGGGLVLAAVLWIACEGIVRHSRKLPRESHVLALWYRSELERLRDFHSGAWCWSRIVIMTPGPIVICYGFWLAHPTLARAVSGSSILACFFVLILIAARNQPRLAATFQRRIDELDVIERGEV